MLPQGQVETIRIILFMLDAANNATKMNFPGSNLHPLNGNRKGYLAVREKANWRIIFQFEMGMLTWQAALTIIKQD